MRADGSFHAAYKDLEGRTKKLVYDDGDIYVPNTEPVGPVDHVFICMEPSLGWFARSAEEARSKVDAGFRNFLFPTEDFILHFCIRRYLCESTQRYHITDFCKGAMLVERAGLARIQRYNRWYPLLSEEIDLVATSDATIVAVGKVVAQHLKRQGSRGQQSQHETGRKFKINSTRWLLRPVAMQCRSTLPQTLPLEYQRRSRRAQQGSLSLR